jgi:hypothetical protein
VLAPAPSAPAFPHLAVHRDDHKLVALSILKLDDLMAPPGEVALPARLSWALLNNCEMASSHCERHHPEASAAGSADGEDTSILNDFTIHTTLRPPSHYPVVAPDCAPRPKRPE